MSSEITCSCKFAARVSVSLKKRKIVNKSKEFRFQLTKVVVAIDRSFSKRRNQLSPISLKFRSLDHLRRSTFLIDVVRSSRRDLSLRTKRFRWATFLRRSSGEEKRKYSKNEISSFERTLRRVEEASGHSESALTEGMATSRFGAGISIKLSSPVNSARITFDA